jgi:hypothetical protein
MAIIAVSSLFAGYEEAVAAVRELEEAGFLADGISILPPRADPAHEEIGNARGVIVGGAIGAAAGSLAGFGEAAFLSGATFFVAGWVVTLALWAVVGAGVGSSVASLFIKASGSRAVAVTVEAGHGSLRAGAVVTIYVDAESEGAVQSILARHNAAAAGGIAPRRHGAIGGSGYARAFQTETQRREERRSV